MAHLSRDFDAAQRRGLVRVDHPEDIAPACPQNFNGFSECFAAVVFNGFPAALNAVAAAAAPNATAESKNATAAALNATDPSALLHNAVNYTIQADAGLYHIDVRGRSDYERRVLPLQLALDSAIASLLSNSTLPTPLEWPFTRETNAEQATRTRLSALRRVTYRGAMLTKRGRLYTRAAHATRACSVHLLRGHCIHASRRIRC
jgi:ATP-binding cassette subfamily A (ABC1) protein 3